MSLNHFYVGQKHFGWSLVFMAELLNEFQLQMYGRILIHGAPGVVLDSQIFTVDLPANNSSYLVIFETSPITMLDNPNVIPNGNQYHGLVQPDNLTLQTFHIPITITQTTLNNRTAYAIVVKDMDITIKWIVGARHIVVVDPTFASNGFEDECVLSDTNETSNNY